ncbi:MAG: hypothetical protein FWE83_06160 [Oscillospiraceae bacterium]|nr:hypothetical protein [Oscillospiraceae bacterium]
MPDKKSESKLKAMLERTGVIRKVDESSKPVDLTDPGYNSDIKPLFDIPGDTVKVTPAARQPIPGMPTPVFPSEKPSEASYTQPHVEERIETEIAEDVDMSIYEKESIEIVEEPVRQQASQAYVEPSAVQQPASYGEVSPAQGDYAYPETQAIPAVSAQRDLQSENYTDRFLNTEELYEALSLTPKKTDSIYLIEEYLQTLPDSLPDSQRRDIVAKLLAASGFDYDLLMGDGVLRVKMLKEYAERFARHTDDYIAARQAELDELEQQILRTRRLIENRKDLHKKQFFSIEAEAQRLKEVLTYISG